MFFTKIFTWLLDPKNRTLILFVFIAIVIGLFFWQRSRTQHFKFKYEEEVKENERITNNYLASVDTLKQYKGKNGELIGEISAYKITEDEMKTKYANLFNLYTIEKNKPPKFIVETRWKVVENINDIPTEIIGDSLITFRDSTNFGNGNWRIIEAEIPYKFEYRLKKDSANLYEFQKALVYAFDLQQRGVTNASVVAYKNGQPITYLESQTSDSIIYRIQIYESNIELSVEQIADKFNIDRDYIDKVYENNKFVYLTGSFIPKSNIEAILDKEELLTYSELMTGKATSKLKLGMSVATALVTDKETGKLKIQVVTKYPGVTFEEITGAEIMQSIKENKKAARQLRQEFGVGLNLGVGGMLVPDGNSWTMKFGPVISVGLNWTPRWAQFGPRQNGKNSLDALLNP